VIFAFDELLTQGHISIDEPISCAYDFIRKFLSAKFPDRAGVYCNMSNETIRSHISSFYKK
jgi:hypothetical protein